MGVDFSSSGTHVREYPTQLGDRGALRQVGVALRHVHARVLQRATDLVKPAPFWTSQEAKVCRRLCTVRLPPEPSAGPSAAVLGVAGGARGTRDGAGADGAARWQLHGLHTIPLACIRRPTGIQVVRDIVDRLTHDGGHYGAIEASLAGMRNKPPAPRVEINARLSAVPAGGGIADTYPTTRRTEGGLRGRLWGPELAASRPRRTPARRHPRHPASIAQASSPSDLPCARPGVRQCAVAAQR